MAQLCRSLGGVLSVAIFGSILNARLELRVDPKLLRAPRKIDALPEPSRTEVINAMLDGITTIFRYAIPLMVIAFLISTRVKELPLRTHAAYQDSDSASNDAART